MTEDRSTRVAWTPLMLTAPFPSPVSASSLVGYLRPTLLACAALALTAGLMAPAQAQNAAGTGAATPPAAVATTPKVTPEVKAGKPATSATPWSSLNPSQKEALAPLAASWASLTEGQQRKWIAVAQNFGKLGASERDKLHGRMADWAALSPKDRERARLNFAQAKKVEPEQRAATWEAYQSLSPEEKKAHAAGATPKPGGAAIAAKPVPADKLAPVPVTRRTPDKKTSQGVASAPLDRNTLLPLGIAADSAKP